MSKKEKPSATIEEFFAQCHESFAFLQSHGFAEVPLPNIKWLNPVQIHYSNGKVLFIAAGINWGKNAEFHFQDNADLQAPLFLFVPSDKRQSSLVYQPDEPDQCYQIRVAAQKLKDYCADLLAGDLTRFVERATYWKRTLTGDLSHQKRFLP
jgi:hypothetical protein